jgi:FkbM family methyltransferase
MTKLKRILSRLFYYFLFQHIDNSLIYLRSYLIKQYGKIEHQDFFNKLHAFSLDGMNYINNNPENNGEYFILKLLSENLNNQEEIIVFDCGANIGDYTIEICKYFSNTRIHCFEPSIETFKKLIDNAKKCKNIVYNNLGVGDEKKDVTLYISSEISALASIYKRNLDYLDIHLDKKETITLTTLDEYCNQNSIKKIDFLKLDIEGNEFAALNGAINLIKEGQIKHIQFEMGGCNIDSKIFWKDIFYLLSPYYNLYRIVANGIYEFITYSEKDEIFVYSNYFAKLRQ